MSTSTLREHSRHQVHTECVLRARKDDRLIADRTLDVSWSGIRVRSLVGARVGERVRISLRIPDSITWLDAEGEVTRVCEGRREGEDGATLGVRVKRMDGMHRLLLATVIRHYPLVPAERGEERNYARVVQRIADGT